MPSVCLYFQVHQPYRVNRFSCFDSALWRSYFDDEKNSGVMAKVAEHCYLPANRRMLALIKRHGGRFRIAYSISGVALEQMQLYAPEALQSFRDLAGSDCVEFCAETYYHSLAALFSRGEFEAQVRDHSEITERLLGRRPVIFRNTELLYDDGIGQMAADLGFRAVLAEGADDILAGRTPNHVYGIPGRNARLLLRDYRYSDDIAFRFSDSHWHGYPLTPAKFAGWLHRLSGEAEVVNLFMDYETFGEHQWAPTGIFEFLEGLPGAILADSRWNFLKPSEVIERCRPAADLCFRRLTSWADNARDSSAWTGNRLQKKALQEIWALEKMVRQTGNPVFLETWRKLLQSDHFYYMSTKLSADGEVHHYFNAFESPYDAFLNFMNVVRDFRLAMTGQRHPIGRTRPIEKQKEAVQAVLAAATGKEPQGMVASAADGRSG